MWPGRTARLMPVAYFAPGGWVAVCCECRAAARKSISQYSPLLQSAAAHDRYFPGLDEEDVIETDWETRVLNFGGDSDSGGEDY